MVPHSGLRKLMALADQVRAKDEVVIQILSRGENELYFDMVGTSNIEHIKEMLEAVYDGLCNQQAKMREQN